MLGKKRIWPMDLWRESAKTWWIVVWVGGKDKGGGGGEGECNKEEGGGRWEGREGEGERRCHKPSFTRLTYLKNKIKIKINLLIFSIKSKCISLFSLK